MQQKLKQLKCSMSLQTPDGMSILWHRRSHGTLDADDITKGRERQFTQNNGIIAFVHEGELYVTPFAKEAHDILTEAGFVRTDNLFVPFSTNNQPEDADALSEWKQLLRDAKKSVKKSKSAKDAQDPQVRAQSSGQAHSGARSALAATPA